MTIRRLIAALCLSALVGCAASQPVCDPRQGGIGGTGGCPPEQPLE